MCTLHDFLSSKVRFIHTCIDTGSHSCSGKKNTRTPRVHLVRIATNLQFQHHIVLLSTHSPSLLGGGGVRFSCFMGFRHQLLPPVCYGQGCYAGGILPQIQGQQVICGQLKRCCVVCSGMRQRGQSGDGCVEASILCRYHKRKEDLFVLSWAMVRPYRASSILFDVYV